VGLLDADVHGPSLPSLVAVPDDCLPLVRRDDAEAGTKLLQPPEVEGIRLMSYGLVGVGSTAGDRRAAILKGPRVASIVSQMAAGTEWGALDYLVVDMPPGTGDAQLALCDRLDLSAAVVVTTPQELSRVDVVRGLDMFGTLRVPVAALVENMSWFDAPDTGQRYFPFGQGHMEELEAHPAVARGRSGSPCGGAVGSFRMPIATALSALEREASPGASETGSDSSAERIFAELAEHLVRHCARNESEREEEAGVTNAEPRKATVRELARTDRSEAVAPALGPSLESSDGRGGVTRLHVDQARALKPGLVLRFLSGERAGQEHVVPLSVLRAGSSDAAPATLSAQREGSVSIGFNDGHESRAFTYDELIDFAQTRER
jgi:Mrp family chromosome partitioning ATPase/DUF971 family protein